MSKTGEEEESNEEFSSDSRMSKFLLENMSAAIDELFYMCERNSSQAGCVQVMETLRKATGEFQQLEQRIQAIKKAHDSKPRSLAWTVSSKQPAPNSQLRLRENIENSKKLAGDEALLVSPKQKRAGSAPPEEEIAQKAWADYDSEDEIDFSELPSSMTPLKSGKVDEVIADKGCSNIQAPELPTQYPDQNILPTYPSSNYQIPMYPVPPVQPMPQLVPMSLMVRTNTGQMQMIQVLQNTMTGQFFSPYAQLPNGHHNTMNNLQPAPVQQFNSLQQAQYHQQNAQPQYFSEHNTPVAHQAQGMNYFYESQNVQPNQNASFNELHRAQHGTAHQPMPQQLSMQPSPTPPDPKNTKGFVTSEPACSLTENNWTNEEDKTTTERDIKEDQKQSLNNPSTTKPLEAEQAAWTTNEKQDLSVVPLTQPAAEQQQKAVKATSPEQTKPSPKNDSSIPSHRCREKNKSRQPKRHEDYGQCKRRYFGPEGVREESKKDFVRVVPGKVDRSEKRSYLECASKSEVKTIQIKADKVTYLSKIDISKETESRRMFPRLIASGDYKPKVSSPKKKKADTAKNLKVVNNIESTKPLAEEDDVAYPPLTSQNLKTVSQVIIPSSSPPSNASTRTGSSFNKGKRNRQRIRKRKNLNREELASEAKCRLFHAIEISGFKVEHLNGVYKKKCKVMSGRATYWKDNGDLVLWWNSTNCSWLISSAETMKGKSDIVLASVKDSALDPQFTKGSWRYFQIKSQTWVDNNGISLRNIQPRLHTPENPVDSEKDIFSHKLASDVARSAISEGVFNYRMEQANSIRETLRKMSQGRKIDQINTKLAPPGPFRTKLRVLLTKADRLAEEIKKSGQASESKSLETALRDVHKAILTQSFAKDVRYTGLFIRLMDSLFQFCPQFSSFSLRTRRSMIQVINGCVSQNEAVRSHLVRGNLIINLFDLGGELITQFERKADHSPILSALLNILTLALDQDTESEPQLRMVKFTLLRYVAVNGFLRSLVKMMHLVTSRCRGIVTRHLTTIKCLTKLVNVLVTYDSSLKFECVWTEKRGSEDVIQVMRETNVAGVFALLSLLTLERYPNKQQWGTVWKKRLPFELTDTLIVCLQTINEVARMRLSLLHEMTVHLQLELHHCLSFLLGYVSHQANTKDDGDKLSWNRLVGLSRELIVLIGYCALNNEEFKDSFRWGGKFQSSLLRTLCDLPMFFFSNPTGKDILIPTLIIGTFQQPLSLDLLAKQVSPLHLIKYLRVFIEKQPEETAPNDICHLGLRIPPSKWNAALEFLQQVNQ